MTKNEVIKRLNMLNDALNEQCFDADENSEALQYAIEAIEELQRWHTSEINPKIKNVFANLSTQICHNCDHKDEYIEELEAEIEQYRAIGTIEELQTMKDNGCFTGFELAQIAAGQKLLKEYQAVGTVEECKEAVKN